MRLITLGDSMSLGKTPWPCILSDMINFELINLAKPASQNLFQSQLFQDWMLDNDLKHDDIVIWQISASSGPVLTLENEHLDKLERTEKLIQKKFSMSHYHIKDKNKIDGQPRINLLSVSPLYRRFENTIESHTEVDTLQHLLFMFVIIKKICPRLLIVVGMDWAIKSEHWESMTAFLAEKQIDFLDKSIMSWCRENNLDFLEDQIHPTPNSFKTYTSNVLFEKLKELNWI